MTNPAGSQTPDYEAYFRRELFRLTPLDALLPGWYAQRTGRQNSANWQFALLILSALLFFGWVYFWISALTRIPAYALLMGFDDPSNIALIGLYVLPLPMLTYPGNVCVYVMQCRAVLQVTADLKADAAGLWLSDSRVRWLCLWRGLLLPGVDAWQSKGWLLGLLVGLWYVLTWLPIALVGVIFVCLWSVGILTVALGGSGMKTISDLNESFVSFLVTFPGTWIALFLYVTGFLLNMWSVQNRLYEDGYA